ncbi:MAG: hypothetical protein R3C08_07110 [Hyphomonas sp.]
MSAGIAAEVFSQQTFQAAIEHKIDQLLSLPAGSIERYKRNRVALVKPALSEALDLEEKELIEATTRLVKSRTTPSLIVPTSSRLGLRCRLELVEGRQF